MKKQFNVISPDGFPMYHSKTFDTREDAMTAFNEWKKNFENQGYYSSSQYGRISLDKLFDYCELIEI
jgi:hypothetical protein